MSFTTATHEPLNVAVSLRISNLVSHRSVFKSSGLNWSSWNMIGPISALRQGRKGVWGWELRPGLSCDINRKPRQAFNQRWTRNAERREPQLQAKEAPSTRSRLTGRRLRLPPVAL